MAVDHCSWGSFGFSFLQLLFQPQQEYVPIRWVGDQAVKGFEGVGVLPLYFAPATRAGILPANARAWPQRNSWWLACDSGRGGRSRQIR